MLSFLSVYKKELVSYFNSLISYIFIIVFLVILSWLFWQNVFLAGQTSMRDFFTLIPWFFLILVPALSMRLWSEENKQGTIETLLTLPVSDVHLVLAKFLSAASFVAVVLLCSLPLPITLSRIGNLDWGPVIGSYLGAWLLGCAYLALGQWLSALTKNQIVAYLVTAAIAFVFLLLGTSAIASGDGVFAKLCYTLSTQTHFASLAKGIISVRDVIYYLSFIGIFLYLNVYTLTKRHFA
ncbi:MAG: ABC transporter permease subunit [Patescibacteria group bacterium]|jgi:ABC-2 type transport system permease protein